MTTGDRQILFLAVATFVGGAAIGRAAVEGMDDLKSGKYKRSEQPKMTRGQAGLAALVCGALVYKMIQDYEEHGVSAVLVGQ